MLDKIKFTIKAAALRRRSAPNKKFVHALNFQISESLAAKYGRPAFVLSPVFKLAATCSAVVIVFISGVGVYAQGNPNVNETSILYPLKRSIEDMRDIAAFSPQKRAEARMNKAEARLQETERLSEKNIVAKRALKDANKDVREAIKLSRKINKEEDSEKVVRKIENLDARRAEKIDKLLSKKNGKIKEAVAEVMEDEDFADDELIGESNIRDVEVLEKGVGRRIKLMNRLSEND